MNSTRGLAERRPNHAGKTQQSRGVLSETNRFPSGHARSKSITKFPMGTGAPGRNPDGA